MFADLNSRNIGGNWSKLAAAFGRRVGFEIEGIDVGRTSGKVDVNQGLARSGGPPGQRRGTQQLRQGKAARSEPAYLEEMPSRQTVAGR